MKAIGVHEFGGPEVLRFEEVPTPQLGPGQLLVRMQAIGVNPVETYIRAGTYKEFPLAEAAQAHRAVMEPGALGKIVLVTGK